MVKKKEDEEKQQQQKRQETAWPSGQPERWSRNPAIPGSIPALATEIVYVWVVVWTQYNIPTMLCT